MITLRKLRAVISAAVLATMLALPLGTLAQTRVVAPKNPYSLDKDVQLGRQAAQQAERQLPLLNDNPTQAYIARIGQRLAEAIPPEFQHAEFRYSYKVVDVKDVNAFALPGGFTYVNRGLIETAQNEAQLAGVIAHEISHVALRHGTAQAAKAQKYQAGSIAAQILGAVIGGGAGQVIGAAGQLGIGAAFLRFSRDYERQADTLGAQIMARAGYDPRELANMFRLLEQQGGRGGPEILSDHPNPGNRYEAINREAALLNMRDGERDTQDFHRIQGRLRDMPRARSMSDVGRNTRTNTDSRRYPPDSDRDYPNTRRYPDDSGRLDPRNVSYPSSRFRAYDAGAVRLSVPDNWREISGGGNEVTYAPEGGYGPLNGNFVITHGAQIGLTSASSRDLRDATDRLIEALGQGNNDLRRYGAYQRAAVGNRNGLAVSLRNVSEVTGQPETLTLLTTFTNSGELLYVIFVAPTNESGNYQGVFQRIARSLVVNQ